MKNIASRVVLGFVALALSSCANYTLITLKVDVASLVGEAALKTTLQFSIPTLVVNETVPNKFEGQLIDNFPKLDVLNSAKLDILVLTGDGSGNTAKIAGSFRVYVAPPVKPIFTRIQNISSATRLRQSQPRAFKLTLNSRQSAQAQRQNNKSVRRL